MAIASGRELVGNPKLGQSILQNRTDDVAQRHRGGSDLRAYHAKSARDILGTLADFGAGQTRSEVGMLSYGRNDGHKVRLAGSVIADY